MNEYLGRLEKLAELKASGVLTDDEFAAEKATLLQRDPQRPRADAQAPQARQLSPKWQKRFEFFRDYGVPLSVAGQERLRELPFGERRAIVLNFPGLLFGQFYFLFLGLWRHALTLLVFQIVLDIALENAGVAELWQYVLALGFWVLCGVTVNYAYYRKQTTGRESWNPFEMWGAGGSR